jgi:ABC-2 type transport system permease protein
MSVVAQPARRPASERSHGGVTQTRVLRSEWTKLWSLRSTRWSLVTAVVGMAGLGMLIAAFRMGHWSHLSAQERASYDPIDNGVGGYHLAQLAIGVLGVLVISGEYATGMIRSSFMAVPHRLPVLWAKAATFAAVTFTLMLPSTFVSFLGVQAIVSQHHLQASVGDPHALRAIVGTALFLTVLAVLAVGIGGLVRSTAGGIATLVGLLFVLPGITALLPSNLGDAISPYLPLNAGFAVATSTFDNSHHLMPWTGFAVFCGYAALALGLAALTLIRRDA